jgi:hypothetical protein
MLKKSVLCVSSSVDRKNKYRGFTVNNALIHWIHMRDPNQTLSTFRKSTRKIDAHELIFQILSTFVSPNALATSFLLFCKERNGKGLSSKAGAESGRRIQYCVSSTDSLPPPSFLSQHILSFSPVPSLSVHLSKTVAGPRPTTHPLTPRCQPRCCRAAMATAHSVSSSCGGPPRRRIGRLSSRAAVVQKHSYDTGRPACAD